MKQILLILLVTFASLQAKSIDKLSEALPYIDDNTMVIVDVHNTLVRPAQQLGTHKWGAYLYQKFVDEGMSPDDAMREARRRVFYVIRMTEMLPVEPETATIIRDLQDSGITVFALTGSTPDFSEVIPGQLLKSSIDLERTSPVDNGFALEMPGGAKFEEGILYAAGNDKGEVLKNFLALSGLHPERIVYIDDRQKEVDSVKQTLNTLEIEGVGLRYDGAVSAEAPIEPEVVELQWKQLGKVLSDEQARALLKKHEPPSSPQPASKAATATEFMN